MHRQTLKNHCMERISFRQHFKSFLKTVIANKINHLPFSYLLFDRLCLADKQFMLRKDSVKQVKENYLLQCHHLLRRLVTTCLNRLHIKQSRKLCLVGRIQCKCKRRNEELVLHYFSVTCPTYLCKQVNNFRKYLQVCIQRRTQHDSSSSYKEKKLRY